MTTRNKRLLIALLFIIISIISLISMIKNGFNTSSLIYTLIIAGVGVLFLKNAIRP